ncbi:hypothetical protein VD0004_g7062 [Verticillium dahliae]|nr:hypothetical protein VD0004_g7062 [Verticillium dahliae]
MTGLLHVATRRFVRVTQTTSTSTARSRTSAITTRAARSFRLQLHPH